MDGETSTRGKARRLRNLRGFQGHASLYECSPPLHGHRLVVASAAIVPLKGMQTFLFGADSRGNVIDWDSPMDGSMKGTLCHAEAFHRGGSDVEFAQGA